MNINHHLRRLPLAGAKNARDLGGYPCPGGAVRWGLYVRSDCPESLTPQDIEYLAAYGVRDVVDLRRADEDVQFPSKLVGAPGFAVHAISLHNTAHGMDFEGDVPGSMAGLYMLLLDTAQDEIRQVMQTIVDAPAGVLFHCAAGKDRTGVIAMLLLKLAGVADADVIADYAITEIYMDELYNAQQGAFNQQEIPAYVLRSIPASMERVLRHLREQYGTAEAFLTTCGLSRQAIDTLKARLVEPAQ